MMASGCDDNDSQYDTVSEDEFDTSPEFDSQITVPPPIDLYHDNHWDALLLRGGRAEAVSVIKDFLEAHLRRRRGLLQPTVPPSVIPPEVLANLCPDTLSEWLYQHPELWNPAWGGIRPRRTELLGYFNARWNRERNALVALRYNEWQTHTRAIAPYEALISMTQAQLGRALNSFFPWIPEGTDAFIPSPVSPRNNADVLEPSDLPPEKLEASTLEQYINQMSLNVHLMREMRDNLVHGRTVFCPRPGCSRPVPADYSVALAAETTLSPTRSPSPEPGTSTVQENIPISCGGTSSVPSVPSQIHTERPPVLTANPRLIRFTARSASSSLISRMNSPLPRQSSAATAAGISAQMASMALATDFQTICNTVCVEEAAREVSISLFFFCFIYRLRVKPLCNSNNFVRFSRRQHPLAVPSLLSIHLGLIPSLVLFHQQFPILE